MIFRAAIALFFSMALPVWGVEVSPQEMESARRFANDRIAWLSGAQLPEKPEAVALKQGWDTLHFGWSVNHRVLTLKSTQFFAGYGSHADAVVEYILPQGAIRLTGKCGVDDTEDARQHPHPVQFAVELDGKQCWQGRPQTALDSPAAFDVDVSKAGKAHFIAKATTDDQTYCPADFVDLHVQMADGSTRELGQRIPFGTAVGRGVSFDYGQRPTSDLTGGVSLDQRSLPPTQFYTVEQFTHTDLDTRLQYVVELRQYKLFPVVEWTMRLTNTGSKDTPVLEHIRSMDLSLQASDKLLLHYHTGDYANEDSYEPHITPLTAGMDLNFAPQGGRPTDKAWPYYNLENPAENCGLIEVVGWSGQWAASFSKSDQRLILHAGQELTHFVLHPGESASTPISVVMFYHGDATRGQNLFRRWMLEENMPRPGGKSPLPINASSLGLHQSEQTEIAGIDLFTAHDAQLSHWWMDAGWYPCKNWWDGVGTWTPDPQRFPNGVKAVSDHAHAKGLKLILWLEPERAVPGSDLYLHHPEFLLGKDGEDKLFDLGNPAAWNWMCNHIDQLITTQGVDLYRQDFNEEALHFWRVNDAADRQGITEMRHIEGYHRLWDELHARHPNLLIDTCASGGRRLDLETLRRSVPLWRSDDSENAEHNQCQTFGLASWIPLFGSGTACNTAYTIRSEMLPFFTLGMGPDGREPDWNLYHQEKEIWNKIHGDFLGDYYPLLPYSRDSQSWIAWEFNRAENGSGVVQAFRRPNSPFEVAKFRLHDLEPNANYVVTNLDDASHAATFSGRQLLEDGVSISLEKAPAAAIVMFHRK